MKTVMDENLRRRLDEISDYGAERAVLSILLNDDEMYYDIVTELSASDFQNIGNRHIFEIMCAIMDGVYEGIRSINSHVIYSIARQSGVSEDFVSIEYLDILKKTEINPKNMKHYINSIKSCTVRRKSFVQAISVIDDSINTSDTDIDSFTSRQEEKFLNIIIESKGGDRVVHVSRNLGANLKRRAENPREILGVRTGFAGYDEQTGGAVPGRLSVIAARPKTGKSAVALNIAHNISVFPKPDDRVPVLYIDTEMLLEPDQQDRLTSIVSGVPERYITNGTYTNNSKFKSKIDEAVQVIEGAPFYHVYMPDFTAEKIINLVRKMKKKIGITWNGISEFLVVIFDYIKLGDASDLRHAQETQLIGALTSKLKNQLAGDLNVPVMTFCQVGRAGANTENQNASMVFGSDRILQFCSNLSFLRKKTHDEMMEDGAENGNMILELTDSRHGGNYKGWFEAFRNGVPRMTEIRNVAI